MAALMALTGLTACSSDGDVATGPNPSAQSSSSSAAAAPSVPTVWPLRGSSVTYDRPEDAALAFAREYLGMGAAGMTESPAPTGGTARVNVQPFSGGGPVTAVSLVRQGGTWAVTGAQGDFIKVAQPRPGTALTAPLPVSGTSTAFEATINLELRPLGSVTRTGKIGVANGGSNGEFAPFSTQLPVPAGTTEAVLVVYEPDASGRGTMSNATVIVLGASEQAP